MSHGIGYRAALDAAHRLATAHVEAQGERPVAHPQVPDAPAPPDGVRFDAALRLVEQRIVPWLSASPAVLPRALARTQRPARPRVFAAQFGFAEFW